MKKILPLRPQRPINKMKIKAKKTKVPYVLPSGILLSDDENESSESDFLDEGWMEEYDAAYSEDVFSEWEDDSDEDLGGVDGLEKHG